jgi:polynucleotide 5'-kinase involved in rRNA processing
MWRAVVKNIVEHAGAKEGLKVLVLGDSNAGKSTFCLYLANRCISAGMKPCIVDSDIGQSDLGPHLPALPQTLETQCFGAGSFDL